MLFRSLLFNQFFCVGNKQILTDNCKLVILQDGRNELNFESEKMIQKTEISKTYSIEKVLLKAKNTNYQLETSYSDFTVVNGISFPQYIGIQASNLKSKASCDFSILKVEFNAGIKLVHSNTDRYTAGEIDKLLNKEPNN